MNPSVVIFGGGVVVGFLAHLAWDELKRTREEPEWRPKPVRPEHAYCADCEAAVTVTFDGRCGVCQSGAVETVQRAQRTIRLTEPPPLIFVFDHEDEVERG